MKNSIFTKFLLAVMIIVIVIAAQGVISYYLFQKNGELEEELMTAHQLQTFLAEREIDHHLWMIRIYDMFAGGPIPEGVESYQDCNLGQWYYDYEPRDYNRQPYEELKEPHQILHESSQEVLNLFADGNEEEAIELFRENTIPAVNEVRDNLTTMKELESERVANLETEMAALDNRINQIIIISGIVAFIIAVTIALILSRHITGPIGEIVSVAEVVAGGDLTRKLKIDRGDELGQLADSFNAMIDKLRDIVRSITSESEEVVEASTQLKMTSEETGKTAEEIAT
ncbi:MAG: methyl-accepting chemotaxis protein, partial [Halanaerobiales bacterium]